MLRALLPGIDGRAPGTASWHRRACSGHKFSILFRHRLNMDGVEFCLLAQTLHPLPVSIKSDGMKFCFLAQAIHPLPASLKSDGMTDMKCVNGLPSTERTGRIRWRLWAEAPQKAPSNKRISRVRWRVQAEGSKWAPSSQK